jgi:hypothetical protein
LTGIWNVFISIPQKMDRFEKPSRGSGRRFIVIFCRLFCRHTAPRIGAARSTDNGARWEGPGIVLEAPPGTLDCATANHYFCGGNGNFCIEADAGPKFVNFFLSTYTGSLVEQGVSVARMAYADRDRPAGKVWKWRNANGPNRVWADV